MEKFKRVWIETTTFAQNTKFLITDYPRTIVIEVFRRFYFSFGDNNRPECSGLYFTSPETVEKQFRPLLRRGK